MSIGTILEINGIAIAAMMAVIAILRVRTARDKKSETSVVATKVAMGLTLSTTVAVGIVIGLFGTGNAGTGTPEIGPSSNSSPTATASSPRVPPVSGSITFPANGATNVPRSQELMVAGSARNIGHGYHLNLFLSIVGSNKYFTSDPSSIKVTGTGWTGVVFISPSLPPGEHFTLWLVDLGPKSFSVLSSDATGQDFGFPTLKLGSDSIILYAVTFSIG
jgi:hypothetical protein